MSTEIKGTLTPENSKCKPISKYLLTPCRRPGLSRKIKTPLNAIQKQDCTTIINTPEQDKSSDISSVLSPLILNTTTKEAKSKNGVKSCLKETAFKKSGKIGTKLQDINNQDVSYTHTVLKKPEDDANKIKTSQSQFDPNERTLRKSKLIDTNLKDISNYEASQERTRLIDEKTVSKEASEKNKLLKSNSSVSTELKTKISERIDINKVTISDCPSYQSDSSTSSNQSGKSNKNKLKRLSMKKISTSQDTITDFKDTLENNSSSIGSEEPKTSNEGLATSESLTKSKKRSAPSDEDAVYSEDEFSKIEEIKKRVKLKELQLDDLKRAAVYTKLHNLEDLQELSKTWRIGCKKALTQLLNKLQEHGQIEMTTLLRKFNIPESLMNINDCDN